MRSHPLTAVTQTPKPYEKLVQRVYFIFLPSISLVQELLVCIHSARLHGVNLVEVLKSHEQLQKQSWGGLKPSFVLYQWNLACMLNSFLSLLAPPQCCQ